MYCPILNHSHYSFSEYTEKDKNILLNSTILPEDLVKKSIEYGYKCCGIIDVSSISGTIKFIQSCKKNNIKPIIGCYFFDKSNYQFAIIAKNTNGWNNLLKLTGKANQQFNKKPILNISDCKDFKDVICVVGGLTSEFAQTVFSVSNFWLSESPEKILKENWETLLTQKINEYIEIFGREALFIGIQSNDYESLPAQRVLNNCLRKVCQQLGVVKIAFPETYYIDKKDSIDFRLLLSIASDTLISNSLSKLTFANNFKLAQHFKSNQYFFKNSDAIYKDDYNQDEIDNTHFLAEQIESYDLFNKNYFKKFTLPEGYSSSSEYLTQLCRDGWKVKFSQKMSDEKRREYGDRIKRELAVLKKAKLEDYFLVVRDYCNWAKNQGWLLGPGRGSSSGCLVSYLLDITKIDPMIYGLSFERFYNEGRNSPGKIALPDIDSDFPRNKRNQVIEYIKNIYGNDYVAHICTFGKLKGKGAVKDVLRVNQACSFDEMNKITKFIYDESKISDQLQALEEAGEEASIVKYSIDNQAELKEWVFYNDDGELEGDFSQYFKQAIRVEGLNRSQGRHASGIVIASEKISEICPTIHDKSKDCVLTGLTMDDLEAINIVKYDVLGIKDLDCLMGIQSLLLTGEI